MSATNIQIEPLHPLYAARISGVDLRVGVDQQTLAQIRQALDALAAAQPGRREPPEVAERRLRRERGELEALRSILFPCLKATPSVPDRAGDARGGG